MKKFICLLACLSALISIYFISDIYAKYRTYTQGSTNIPIARWNIKVNNTVVKNNSSLESFITPVFPGSEHIASNILAPTAEGYFDLNLDFADVDVSFSYNISILPSETSSVSDLVIKGFAVDTDIENNNITYFDTDTKTISGRINLADNITSRVIRVYILWDDTSDTTLMNNIDDTQTTLDSSGPAVLDVNISFTQEV